MAISRRPTVPSVGSHDPNQTHVGAAARHVRCHGGETALGESKHVCLVLAPACTVSIRSVLLFGPCATTVVQLLGLR